jgi:hypothetical protein
MTRREIIARFNLVAFSGFGFAFFLLALSCGEASWEGSLTGQDGQPEPVMQTSSLTVEAPPALEPVAKTAPLAATVRDIGWPKGKLVPLRQLTNPTNALDRAVLASNPQIYLYPDFDPDADPILVIGMPGWGGRSENFIWTLINGLNRPELTKRLVVASIQDTKSGGPEYQGQGDREHANIWSPSSKSVQVMNRFVATVSGKVGPMGVYFLGYSTGGTSAPLFSTKVARLARDLGEQRVKFHGAVALGTGSRVKAEPIKALGQRVLFVVVPRKRAEDPKALRDDQTNRESGEHAYNVLSRDGAEVYLRHVPTARRHVDWHWGLVSQCRYFKTTRINAGRGYWPNYNMPNPETMEIIATFLQGMEPATAPRFPETACPY